jgi:L-lactate dehydrogenase complex protein LldE
MDRMKVSLFVTCLTDSFYPEVARSAVRILRRLDVEVDFPKKQTCCGQPALNAGCGDDAKAVAARMIDVFESSPLVVTPSGSCCSIVREHFPHMFEDDPGMHRRAVALAGRTYEFVEFLEKKLHVDWGAWELQYPCVATYHYSCHLRGIGMTDEAIRLLKKFKGLEYRQLERMDQCCGFGGTFSVKYGDIAGAMARDKVECIRRTGAEIVVINDGGCTMNIIGAARRAGVNVRAMHIATMLDEAMAATERRRAAS